MYIDKTNNAQEMVRLYRDWKKYEELAKDGFGKALDHWKQLEQQTLKKLYELAAEVSRDTLVDTPDGKIPISSWCEKVGLFDLLKKTLLPY